MLSLDMQSPSPSPNRLDRAWKRALRRLSPSRRREAIPSNLEGRELQSHAEEDLKGVIGLTRLDEPRDSNDEEIDFIFVHGLGGGSRKTWELSPNAQQYWPRDWLPLDPKFASVRIHSYGYPTDLFEWRASKNRIQDFAVEFLDSMTTSEWICNAKTKVVLIGHSMGGIVIKKAYMLAKERDQKFADRVHSMYFLATPHWGSDHAAFLSSILAMTFGEKSVVDELIPKSSTIDSINESFPACARDLQLHSFYETIPTRIMGREVLVVDKYSSRLCMPDERRVMLHADHRHVCKFRSPDDPNYKTLRNHFLVTIDAILSNDQEAKKRLARLAPIHSASEITMFQCDDNRAPGTCEWLLRKTAYRDWRVAHDQTKPFFWLTGRAGSGKSMLSARVVRDLQSEKLHCSFFFFSSKNQSLSSCLRSLAYQMAASDPTILRKLSRIQHASEDWQAMDDKTLWQKTFVGRIFDSPKDQSTHFWVLDSIDECKRSHLLLTFINRVPPWLKVFFTNRNDPSIEKLVSNFDGCIQSHQIQTEDTIDDLRIYINQKISYLHFTDKEGSKELQQNLLDKASGSFLWTSLVVEILLNSWSPEDAEQILTEIPKGLDEVYERMLIKVMENKRAVILARSIYMWTVLALRPLTTGELQRALKLDTNQTVHSLEKVVPAISGQLIFVNQRQQTEVIHQTAMAYLLKQSKFPELALEKNRCHLRMSQICFATLDELVKNGQHPRTKTKCDPPPAYMSQDFTDYACEYFSDHLQMTGAENEDMWNLLCKFLAQRLPYWIEYLARKQSLRSITKTAQNLRSYLRRRVKFLSPISPQKAQVECWIQDLFRLGTKFSTSLRISPASIHTIIPFMCPNESSMSNYRHTPNLTTGFKINGLTNPSWDDSLARIDFPSHQTCAIASGAYYFAVALTNGSINIYFQASIQPKSSFNHGVRVKTMAFSSDDRYLAASGQRRLSLWDLADGICLWTVDTIHQVLDLIFPEFHDMLSGTTQGNDLTTWDLHSGTESTCWKYIESMPPKALGTTRSLQPGKALFSADYSYQAVYYRGMPLHLFDIARKKYLGTLERSSDSSTSGAVNHYIVEAFAFNPSPEIDVLMVSYGDGELVVYDLKTRQPRYRRPNVFAHCLNCSTNGRTLITGSAQGALRIFEFAGAKGDRLAPLYKVDAQDDGVRDAVFSADGLRFADIRGSQFRVWEPAILASDDNENGSQSDLSFPVSLEMTGVVAAEQPPELEISAICCHPNGRVVFCGRRDGSISCTQTDVLERPSTLYQHASHVSISCVDFIVNNHLLVTSDESGRILIARLKTSGNGFEFVEIAFEIRSEQSVSMLFHDPSGTKILFQGRESTEIWTTTGHKVWKESYGERTTETSFANHPLRSDCFLALSQDGVRTILWETGSTILTSNDDKNSVGLNVTPPTPTLKQTAFSTEKPAYCEDSWSGPFVLYNSRALSSYGSDDLTEIRIWPASNIDPIEHQPRSIPLQSFLRLAKYVRQVICITESLLIFLDVDLWICSLDVSNIGTISVGPKRHFFLLSEWRSRDGTFVIEYVPATREFWLAKKSEILVIGRGLELEEPWVKDMDRQQY